MFLLWILLSKSPAFLMYELLIVSKRKNDILAKDFTVLRGGDSSNTRNNWS